jgi:hypothetical protein
MPLANSSSADWLEIIQSQQDLPSDVCVLHWTVRARIKRCLWVITEQPHVSLWNHILNDLPILLILNGLPFDRMDAFANNFDTIWGMTEDNFTFDWLLSEDRIDEIIDQNKFAIDGRLH